MFTGLFFIKLLVAVGFILLLSVISERVSPKLAGFISGLPTGTAITLFFFAVQSGEQFAADSAVFNLAGMASMQTFIYVYYLVSARIGKNQLTIRTASLINMGWSTLGATTAYAIIITGLQFITFTPLTALVVALCSTTLFIYLFRKIPDTKVEQAVRLDSSVLVVRAVLGAAIILLVTGVAAAVGPHWAGLFSAFPTTLFPLLLIMHFTYGGAQVHTIIKNVPRGQGSMIVYVLAVYLWYPSLGVIGGTVVAFGWALVFLVIFWLVMRRKVRFRY